MFPSHLSAFNPLRPQCVSGSPLRCQSPLTRLHAHKGAPDEHGRAVQQSGDDVAKQQHQISPVFAHICNKVPVQSLCDAGSLIFCKSCTAVGQQRSFLVYASVPRTLRSGVHGGCRVSRCCGFAFYGLRSASKVAPTTLKADLFQ